MRKIVYVTLAAVLLSSCTGIAPFSKQKYGHLKWIHKGAVVEEKTTTVEQGTAAEKQNSVANATETEVKKTAEGETYQAPTPVSNQEISGQPVSENKNTVNRKQQNSQVSVTETRQVKKSKIKSIVRKVTKPANPDMSGDARLIIAILLCIILPPIGVYLYRETSNPFVLTLILCLISAIGFWFFWYSGLLWLIAVIIALLAVLQDA
ncbi:MAG: hypothetical protein ACHQF2_04085 [Flavobacteriales bacterium]